MRHLLRRHHFQCRFSFTAKKYFLLVFTSSLYKFKHRLLFESETSKSQVYAMKFLILKLFLLLALALPARYAIYKTIFFINDAFQTKCEPFLHTAIQSCIIFVNESLAYTRGALHDSQLKT